MKEKYEQVRNRGIPFRSQASFITRLTIFILSKREISSFHPVPFVIPIEEDEDDEEKGG